MLRPASSSKTTSSSVWIEFMDTTATSVVGTALKDSWPPRVWTGRSSENLCAVHLTEWVGDQFDAGSVGIAEVQRDPAVLGDLDRRRGQFLLEVLPPVGGHADRHVVQTPEDLTVRLQVQPRKVEERQQIGVADVEEEVRRTVVVAVLDELGQRELEQLLIEPDGSFDVAADERRVMQSAAR